MKTDVEKESKGNYRKKKLFIYFYVDEQKERDKSEQSWEGEREREKKLTIQRPKQWKGKVLYFNKNKEREKCGNECDIYGQLGRG